jgi:hypothetical protein
MFRHKQVWFVVLAAIALVVLATPAFALQSHGYSLEILVDGKPLKEYAARGTTYIEARKSAEYSIRLRNHTGRRIAIALAVDGLNTINAKTTTAKKASKWVLGPYEAVTIDGWQTGADTARKFFFTTEDKSYGSWLGRTDDLGVIEAVVFREQRPKISELRRRSDRSDKAAPAPQSAGESESTLSDDLAATGIGREVDNRVVRVRFNSEHKAAANLRIRYEYRQQLVELDVLPDCNRLDRREHARGFEDFEFAPDPFAKR